MEQLLNKHVKCCYVDDNHEKLVKGRLLEVSEDMVLIETETDGRKFCISKKTILKLTESKNNRGLGYGSRQQH